ncbi:hypothetical protein XENOCAPTIV_026846 [Xenoophorus captivus]|uniref:Uncharacterized protein n=1 Tax=Xenoophorus captivus TaxID=1517983 RepID=A0ABV0S0Q1_9TELE
MEMFCYGRRVDVTAGGRMCVFVFYLHQQTGQPMSLKSTVFLRAIGTAVSEGIGFLLRWIHSSSLFLRDSGSPCALCTPPAGRLREFMLDYSFPGSSEFAANH